MRILLLVEEFITRKRWTEEYQIMDGEDIVKWAQRSIDIWNNGKSKFAYKRRLILVRKIKDNWFSNRNKSFPWEADTNSFDPIQRTK